MSNEIGPQITNERFRLTYLVPVVYTPPFPRGRPVTWNQLKHSTLTLSNNTKLKEQLQQNFKPALDQNDKYFLTVWFEVHHWFWHHWLFESLLFIFTFRNSLLTDLQTLILGNFEFSSTVTWLFSCFKYV